MACKNFIIVMSFLSTKKPQYLGLFFGFNVYKTYIIPGIPPPIPLISGAAGVS
jgi:hypothetical protein